MTATMRAIHDYYVANSADVAGNVKIGPGVNIWFQCVVRADLAAITIGPRVNLQDGCILHTDRDSPMEIEEGTVIGHGAILHGERIGRDTLIGMGARLLTGCIVGEQCLIAAGSLITEGRRIPPRSVVVGIPGRVLRAVTDEELERTHKICTHYLEMAQRYVRGAYPPPWHRS